MSNEPISGEITDAHANSPAAQRKRRRFWTIWTIVNVAALFLLPLLYVLLGDVVVQLFKGDDTVRAQAGVGVYVVAWLGMFCVLAPINAVAGIFGLLARAGRKQQQHSTPDTFRGAQGGS